MWKYITRRLKETFERTYNVLDVRKTRTCGSSQTTGAPSDNESQTLHNEKPGSYINTYAKCPGIWFMRCSKTGDSSQKDGNNKSYKKRIGENEENQYQLHHDLLSAITWSGAIICGWYASQLLCLHRRHYGWMEKNRTTRLLNVPTRMIHSNVLSHVVFASPNQPSLLTEKVLKENFSFNLSERLPDKIEPSKNVFNVNNEHKDASDDSSKKQSVEDAVSEFVTFLGETEFRMGVRNIATGDYQSAVTHLKMGTIHNHPGATFNLGLCYEKGLGVKKNLIRAMECYQNASHLGHSKAMYNLGVFYAQGLGGLEKNYDAARQCFIASAKLGQPEAKYALQIDPNKNVSFSKDNTGDKNKINYTNTSASVVL